jgi:hypothetical protein
MPGAHQKQKKQRKVLVLLDDINAPRPCRPHT